MLKSVVVLVVQNLIVWIITALYGEPVPYLTLIDLQWQKGSSLHPLVSSFFYPFIIVVFFIFTVLFQEILFSNFSCRFLIPNYFFQIELLNVLQGVSEQSVKSNSALVRI